MPQTKTPRHPQPAGPKSPTNYGTREDNYKVAGEYPNQNYFRTQAGHTIIMDDTKDKEHITIQHRGGARIQFGATGDIQLVSHNGMYSVILGENRMIVTGTQDITVRGGATLKVDGDYDMTVGGNMNFACDHDFNFKGKNFNVLADNMDMETKNMNLKTEGSINLNAGETLVAQGEKGASLIARGSGGAAVVASASDIALYAKGGELRMQSGGEAQLKAGGNINMDGGNEIWLNSGRSQPAADVKPAAAAVPKTQSNRGKGRRHSKSP